MNLSSLSHLQSLHLILLSGSLTVFYPVFLVPSALPFKKLRFGAQNHLNHVHIPFLFLYQGNNPLCTLSTPSSVEFSLFHFLYFIFFSLTASATSSFHHISLCLQDLLTFHICTVLFPSLSLPVFIYIQVFPLFFHYLISNHVVVFLTSVPPWASIHIFLAQTSYAFLFLY